MIGLFSGLAEIGHVLLDLVRCRIGRDARRRQRVVGLRRHDAAKPAKTVAVASRARKLDMVDHLNLVVQRIDLHRRACPGLLAERLEHLIGGHRGNLDGDVDRLRVGRRGRVERVADALRELGDSLIQRPDHWKETIRCKSSGTSNSHFDFSVGGRALSHIWRHDGCHPGGAALTEVLEAVSRMRE